MLLTIHAIIAAVSVFPVYLLANKILHRRLLALCISVSYLSFTGYQFAVFDGFHQSVFAPFFIGWLYYFLATKKNKLYWLSVAGLIATKEEYSLLVVSIGLVGVFYYKRFSLGLTTIAVGLASFFLLIYVVIPFFQKGSYSHFGYGELGNTPTDVFYSTLTHPLKTLKLLVLPAIKLKTVWSTFLSFGFLPLFLSWHLLPILEQFAVRFVDTVTIHRWTNLNHYAFPLSPLLSVSIIYAIRDFWLKKLSYKKIPIYLLVFAGVQNLIFHGPVNSLFKTSFYETQAWEYDAQQLIAQVPKGVTITSQNSLLPHLSQRPRFYLLPEIGDAEYLAIDLHDGPNKYSPISFNQTKELILSLQQTKKYTLVWQNHDSLLLRRLPQ